VTALRAIEGARHVRREAELREVDPPKTALVRRVEPDRIDSYNSHPAVGLTVDQLLSMYREAERGYPVRQYDTFDDMQEISGHLRGLLIGRVDAVAGCDFIFAPGRDDRPSRYVAEALDERMKNAIAFDSFVEHHLMTPHYGFGVTNTVWDMIDGLVTPAEFVHGSHRRFASPNEERAQEIWLLKGSTSRELVELTTGEFAVSRYRGRNPWAAGSMRTAGWWAMFSRWSIRDWQVFAEMFGLPLVLGFYNEAAGEKSRQKLEEAIKKIGEDGYAVLSDLVEVVIKEARSGDSSTVYPKIAAYCEAQMSKLLAGSTTASDTGGEVGSYSLGMVHESRAYKLSLSDAKLVQRVTREAICEPFTRWNGFDRAAAPRLRIQITRDSLERAKALEIIGQIVDLDPAQIREEFSLRTPATGQGVRMPSKTPAGSAPAGGTKP
jgi:phage gp29-like protein